MLLSELEWTPPDDESSDKRQARCGEYIVFELLNGGFDIWHNAYEHGADAPAWEGLTAIEAQAVLFHLTKQVTENDDENIQDHASC